MAGYTHSLRRGLICHVRATGGVCVCVCVCVCARVHARMCDRGMYPAVLSPFWLFLLLSTASVCTLIKTLNLCLTHTHTHAHTRPPSHSLPPSRPAPKSQFTLYSRTFIYSHICTHFIPKSNAHYAVAVVSYMSMPLSCLTLQKTYCERIVIRYMLIEQCSGYRIMSPSTFRLVPSKACFHYAVLSSSWYKI